MTIMTCSQACDITCVEGSPEPDDMRSNAMDSIQVAVTCIVQSDCHNISMDLIMNRLNCSALGLARVVFLCPNLSEIGEYSGFLRVPRHQIVDIIIMV